MTPVPLHAEILVQHRTPTWAGKDHTREGEVNQTCSPRMVETAVQPWGTDYSSLPQLSCKLFTHTGTLPGRTLTAAYLSPLPSEQVRPSLFL